MVASFDLLKFPRLSLSLSLSLPHTHTHTHTHTLQYANRRYSIYQESIVMRKVVGLINCLSPIPLTNNKLDDPCEMKAAITFGRQIKKRRGS